MHTHIMHLFTRFYLLHCKNKRNIETQQYTVIKSSNQSVMIMTSFINSVHFYPNRNLNTNPNRRTNPNNVRVRATISNIILAINRCSA